MLELKLVLPYPPSVNHYKRVGALVKTKNGKTYQKKINSKETISFYYQVYMLAKANMPQEWLPFADSATISYEVGVYLSPPDNRRRDIDNPIKVLLDSLVHARVIKDDSQITRLLVDKREVLAGGQVIVMIFPLG